MRGPRISKLGRAGRPNRRRRNDPQPIPRIIWSFWDTGWESAPRVARLCKQSWEQLNPDFSIRFLGNESVGKWLEPSLIPRDFSSLAPAHQADVIRLNLLRNHGGYWVDATLFCSRPLSEWVEEETQAGFAVIDVPESTDKLFDNFFIGSVPQGRFVSRWLTHLVTCFNFSRGPMTKQFVKRVLRRVPILRTRWGRALFATKTFLRRLGHPYFLAQYTGTKMIFSSVGIFGLWLRRERYRCGKLSRFFADGGEVSQFSAEMSKNPVGIWKLTHHVQEGQEQVFGALEHEISNFLSRQIET